MTTATPSCPAPVTAPPEAGWSFRDSPELSFGPRAVDVRLALRGRHASALYEAGRRQGRAEVTSAVTAAPEIAAARRRAAQLEQLLATSQAAEAKHEARLADLQARRQKATLETPADLGARLVKLDADATQAQAALDEARAESTKLAEELEAARAGIEAATRDATTPARRQALEALRAERDAVLARLAMAAGPLLDELAALEGRVSGAANYRPETGG